MLRTFKHFTLPLSLKKTLSNTIVCLPRFYNTESETNNNLFEFNGKKLPMRFKTFTSVYSQEDLEPFNSGRVSLISGVPTDALRSDVQNYIKSSFNIDVDLDNILPVYDKFQFRHQYVLQFKTPEESKAVVTHTPQTKYRIIKDAEMRITRVNNESVAYTIRLLISLIM
jgi:hypothetical protein